MTNLPNVAAELGLFARDLGPRGSRSDVSDADPGGELTPSAAAVIAAIPAWWAAQAKAAGLSGEWLDVRAAIDVEAPVLSGPDPILDRPWGGLPAEEVGAAYVGALSAATRARHGRHYTPASLADRLWAMSRLALGHKRAAKPLAGLVRDPACGAGALLLPIIREHIAASHEVNPRVVLAGLPNVIEGIDTDPAAVWIANVVLAAQMLPLLRKVPAGGRKALPALARVGDGLVVDEANARLVIMNPPYGRVRISDEDRDRFAHVLYGHANLYGLFIAAGLEALDSDGILGAVVPTSFTSGRYFSNLRGEIARTAPLRDVTFVSRRGGVFPEVLQETCLAVLSKKRTRRTIISSMEEKDVHAVASVKALPGAGPWLLPRRADDAPIAAAAASMPLTLAAAGWSASTGPLVWNRRKADLYPRGAASRAYVVWAADLDGGTLHRDAARNSLRYLVVHGVKDRKVNVLNEPAVLVQRTTAPEQARRLVAAELTQAEVTRHGGVVVENHVNVLRPSGDALLLTRQTLTRVLKTKTLDRVMRCISGSVALSAYELESLPLPDKAMLQTWESLRGNELEAAVADAYRPVSE